MSGLFSARHPSGLSARRIIEREAADRPYGTVLAYEQLAEALGVDCRDRRVICAAVGAARRILLESHHQALAPVPNVGYRVCAPDEHTAKAIHHRDKSRRQLTVATMFAVHAPDYDMTEEQRFRHQTVSAQLMMMKAVLVDHEIRLRKLESKMD